jgi:AraC-like DNA-binding protein
MVSDEHMAVRFYGIGNARDLADQIIRILRSPELEHRMAEQNFTAGVQMTMTNVIRSYLRWFRLHQAKRAISQDDAVVASRIRWRNGNLGRRRSPRWSLGPGLFLQQDDGAVPHLVSQETDDFLTVDEIEQSIGDEANRPEGINL